VVVKELKVDFSARRKTNYIVQGGELCESIKNSGLEGRGGHISTAKHKDNGLAARVKKCRFKRVLTQTILTKKYKENGGLSMRFIADLVHEKSNWWKSRSHFAGS